MFVSSDFNSKLEAFGCAKKNTSGPIVKNIHNHLNLAYLNNDEDMHLGKRTGNRHLRHGIHITQPNQTLHTISNNDNLGSDNLPIKISIDAQPIGMDTLTTLGTILTRPTEKRLNQLSRQH